VQKKEAGYHLSIKVVQQGEMFVFPLWVEWQGNGKRIRKKIVVDKPVSVFDIDLDYKPSKIKVNPHNAVPGEFD
jgi:hypothetical protein